MHSAALAVGLVLAATLFAVTSSTNNAEEQTENANVSKTEEIVQPEKEKQEKSEAEKNENEEADDEPTLVKVRPGDTLAKIAKEHDTTYRRIFNANEVIENPNIIPVGEKLLIPEDDEDLEDRMGEFLAAQEAQREEEQKRIAHAQEREAERQAATTRQASSEPRQETAPQTTSTSTSVWDRLAECESGGNWSINTGNGYYGGLQFSLSSWRAVGGSGYPHQASKSEQISRAEQLLQIQGWGAWPACSSKLGLR